MLWNQWRKLTTLSNGQRIKVLIGFHDTHFENWKISHLFTFGFLDGFSEALDNVTEAFQKLADALKVDLPEIEKGVTDETISKN